MCLLKKWIKNIIFTNNVSQDRIFEGESTKSMQNPWWLSWERKLRWKRKPEFRIFTHHAFLCWCLFAQICPTSLKLCMNNLVTAGICCGYLGLVTVNKCCTYICRCIHTGVSVPPSVSLSSPLWQFVCLNTHHPDFNIACVSAVCARMCVSVWVWVCACVCLSVREGEMLILFCVSLSPSL